ncbi:MAG: site-2 protease family protein [Myxococcota bacterium]
MQGGLQALLWYGAFVVSVSVHETAHAWAAWLGGDPTASQIGGRSLNPLPRIRREPFGMLIVPLLSALSYGWAIGWATTPYDPRWAARYPRRAAWMAAAGPAANGLLAGLSLAALHAGLASGRFVAPQRIGLSRLVEGSGPLWDAVGVVLSILLVLNVILGLFNLIPFPPLDGASALSLLLPTGPARALRETLRNPWLAGGGLLAAWWLFARGVGPIFSVVLRLVHPGLSYG